MPDLRVRALQLLTRRDHSRAELKSKLAGEAESAEQLDAVLDRLEAERLLSDHRYASQRVIARGRRYGNGRLKQELRQSGVSDDNIAAALPEAGDETERCHAVWARKFSQPPRSSEERAKQMRFLQYRGFSGEAIKQTLRQATQGADE
jgi:regulatory protein